MTGLRERLLWLWGEFYVVSGAIQRVNVPDKVMPKILRYFVLIVDIIYILWISTLHGYYTHFMDTNFIGRIMRYLDRNVRPIFHI